MIKKITLILWTQRESMLFILYMLKINASKIIAMWTCSTWICVLIWFGKRSIKLEHALFTCDFEMAGITSVMTVMRNHVMINVYESSIAG